MPRQRLVDRDLWLVVERTGEGGRWVAHCLDMDLVGDGADPAGALDVLIEFVADTIVAELVAGRDPFRGHVAPDERWARRDQIVRSGRLSRGGEQAGDATGLAGILHVTVESDHRRDGNRASRRAMGRALHGAMPVHASPFAAVAYV